MQLEPADCLGSCASSMSCLSSINSLVITFCAERQGWSRHGMMLEQGSRCFVTRLSSVTHGTETLLPRTRVELLRYTISSGATVVAHGAACDHVLPAPSVRASVELSTVGASSRGRDPMCHPMLWSWYGTVRYVLVLWLGTRCARGL